MLAEPGGGAPATNAPYSWEERPLDRQEESVPAGCPQRGFRLRAVLKAHGKTERTVWVADSFEGLPQPDPEPYPADAGAKRHEREDLAVSTEKVRANFERFGLLDAHVRFLKGFFRDTLPGTPIERLALIRLDGDMYESTWDGLSNLYPKLSPGGFLIVDDYGAVEACRQAVHDYRGEHGIEEPIEKIDWTGVFWRRPTRAPERR